MAAAVTSASLVGASADLQILDAATTANAATAAAPAPAANSNNNQDTVTLSSAAQQAPAPTYLEVLLMSEAGQTTQQIAASLGITIQAVEAFLQSQTADVAQPPTTNTSA